VYGIKGFKKIQREREGIGLDEFKREMWLRVNIHANDFKSGTAVTNSNATSAAKQIKKSQFHFQRDILLESDPVSIANIIAAAFRNLSSSSDTQISIKLPFILVGLPYQTKAGGVALIPRLKQAEQFFFV
jgi:hypothetical protein